ncbi:MAG TPA: sulfotransferase, partial [Rubrobacter sp.]|nr:sulfotransferase [Rubrobacter sp.]
NGEGREATEPEERLGAGGALPAPFIVGAERSGTTLLRLMLDAHPQLAIPPETHFIERAAEACEDAPEPRRAFLETVTSHRRWGDFRIEEERLTERVAGIEPFDLGEALRAFYGVYAERFGKPRWGDKTPNYVHRMLLIHGLLPEARFVHIIRDGRDVALSTKDLWFGPDSVEEAARRWQALIGEARRQSKDLPHYLEVRYEDLVSETEPALRRIGHFVDLPWDPAMLAYHTTADERLKEIHRDIETPKGKRVVRGEMRRSLHTLTGKPPQRDRIARWREEMADADRRRFEEVAGDTLRELGYEVG